MNVLNKIRHRKNKWFSGKFGWLMVIGDSHHTRWEIHVSPMQDFLHAVVQYLGIFLLL